DGLFQNRSDCVLEILRLFVDGNYDRNVGLTQFDCSSPRWQPVKRSASVDLLGPVWLRVAVPHKRRARCCGVHRWGDAHCSCGCALPADTPVCARIALNTTSSLKYSRALSAAARRCRSQYQLIALT